MKPKWSEQVALITGGASGIGLATATKLASKGVSVMLVDRNEASARTAAEGLGEASGFFLADVSSEADVAEAVAETKRRFGRLDIVVNCAGITGQTNIKCHEVELEDFRRVLEVNLQGAFLVSKAALPDMVARGYGRILLIASIAGKEGNAGMISYSASKAGVIALAKSMGKEYANTGVTINSLAPAVIRTPIVNALPEAQIEYMTSKIPMQRCGTLDEAAAMCVFAVSPESSFTTGFCFDLSGGRATY